MSHNTSPRDSVSPIPPMESSSQRPKLSSVMRRIGNRLRKKSPEPPHVQVNDANAEPGNSTDVYTKRPVSTIAPSTDGSYAPSVHQRSIKSGANSFESRASRATGISVISHVSRQSARDERAKALHSRFGLHVDPSFPAGTWGDEPLIRVQKNARLRMHANCHLCNTSFRSSSQCPQCQHRRCRLCPRALPKGVQALIDQTRAQLDSIAEPPQDSMASLDLSQIRIEARDMLVATGAKVPDTLAANARLSYHQKQPTPTCHASHLLHTRDLCVTIEQAISSLCGKAFLT